MKVQNRNIIQTLNELYPNHELIELTNDFNLPDGNITAIQLNLECMKVTKQWLEKKLGFESEYDFPYQGVLERDRFISQLVSGFCLKINGHKIVFIPSENLDTDSCEIPQEWVDLSNWMGSYYLPVQVDLEGQYLRLWGAISYQQLKEKGQLDRRLHYYQVEFADVVTNLDVLWASCELEPISLAPPVLLPARFSIADVVRTDVPRITIPFSQWAAILNSPEQLASYQRSSGLKDALVTCLSNWFTQLANDLSEDWQTIEAFFLARPSFRSTTLGRKERQDLVSMQIPDLVRLLEQAEDEGLRWEAADHLRIRQPQHPKLPIQRIRDIGIKQSGIALSMEVSQLSIAQNRRAILVRVQAINHEFLPIGVTLALWDELGEPMMLADGQPYAATSRLQPRDNYIQLYFVVDSDDTFAIHVSLEEHSYQEFFTVGRLPI
jgi:hypothetical protein